MLSRTHDLSTQDLIIAITQFNSKRTAISVLFPLWTGGIFLLFTSILLYCFSLCVGVASLLLVCYFCFFVVDFQFLGKRRLLIVCID